MKKTDRYADLLKENRELKLLVEVQQKTISDYEVRCPRPMQIYNRSAAGFCLSSVINDRYEPKLSRMHYNPGMRRLLEYTEAEFFALGDHCFETIIHADDYHLIKDTIDYLYLNPRKFFLCFCRFITQSKSEIIGLVSSCCHSRDTDGSIEEIISTGIPLEGNIHNCEFLLQNIKAEKQKQFAKTVGKLTKRHKEVLKLWVNGFTKDEIAIILDITSGTVKNHLKKIYERLDAHDMHDIIKIAVKCGLN